MIVETTQEGIRKLFPAEGMVLNKGDSYSSLVYLGIHDAPENWVEIPESEVPDPEDMLSPEEEAGQLLTELEGELL